MTHEVRIAGSDICFPCADGQTLLDAALRAGIEMPYSCRKGVCGNCAGVVSAGEVRCPPTDVAPAGEHLYCQCVPAGDVELRPTSWHRFDPASRKTYTARVYRVTPAAGDVSILQLRFPAGQRARFKAGQYLQVLLPDGSRRSYSMANPPHESDGLQLHVRHVAGGRFTDLLSRLQTGDSLTVELPFGSFELKEASSLPMLCVVGGTGFAPVKSLLDDMRKKAIRRPVTLVWGSRDRAGLYLPAALARWEKSMPGFRFLPAIEDAGDAAALGAFHGRADAAVRGHFATLADHEVYCCGAPAMVDAVRRTCLSLSLPAAHFFSDVFVPGPAAPLA